MYAKLRENITRRILLSKKKTPNKTNGSIKELINLPITQSEVIRLGTQLQRSIIESISDIDGLIILNDSFKHCTMLKNADLIFIYGDYIYNIEFKCNLNLDTGKSVQVCKRLETLEFAIKIALENQAELAQYSGFPIVSRVVGLRFPYREQYLPFLKNRLRNENWVIGYSEFFEIFDQEVTCTEWEDMFQTDITTSLLSKRT
jgi:hypothetical protein